MTFVKESQFNSVPDLSSLSNASGDNTLQLSKHYSLNDIPNEIESDFNIELRNIKSVSKSICLEDNTVENLNLAGLPPPLTTTMDVQPTVSDHAMYVNTVLTSKANMPTALTLTSTTPYSSIATASSLAPLQSNLNTEPRMRCSTPISCARCNNAPTCTSKTKRGSYKSEHCLAAVITSEGSTATVISTS